MVCDPRSRDQTPPSPNIPPLRCELVRPSQEYSDTTDAILCPSSHNPLWIACQKVRFLGPSPGGYHLRMDSPTNRQRPLAASEADRSSEIWWGHGWSSFSVMWHRNQCLVWLPTSGGYLFNVICEVMLLSSLTSNTCHRVNSLRRYILVRAWIQSPIRMRCPDYKCSSNIRSEGAKSNSGFWTCRLRTESGSW